MITQNSSFGTINVKEKAVEQYQKSKKPLKTLSLNESSTITKDEKPQNTKTIVKGKRTDQKAAEKKVGYEENKYGGEGKKNTITEGEGGERVRVLKKRGRKREKWEVYLETAQQKIEEIKEKLKNAKRDGIPVAERQKLRNQVSAQQSRLKKKFEVKYLHNLISTKDQKI